MNSKAAFAYCLIALGISLLASFSFLNDGFLGPERFLEDILVSPRPVDSRIVIAAIDNDSLHALGQWPWPRATFARALENIKKAPPKVAAIDVIWSEPSRAGALDDITLANTLKSLNYPVVLAKEAENLRIQNGIPLADKFIEPLAAFQNLGNLGKVELGHTNLVLDTDGVARSFPPNILNSAGEVTFMPLQAFQTVFENEPKFLEPVTRIVYSAPPGTVRRVSFTRLLDADPPDLTGKILLIGATAADLHDEKPTPLARGTEMPGIEIQANVVNMLLNGWSLRPLANPAAIALIFLAAFLPALFFALFRKTWAAFGFCAVLGAVLALGILLAFERGIIINSVHVLGAWLLALIAMPVWRILVEEKEKREIRNLFSKYVSDAVLNEILKDPSRVDLGGEEREVTVLFSDIRGFTTLSEKTTPPELVRILNTYFSAMTEQVLVNKGVLDKYIGDAIMAFWGAPLDDPDQADNALKAALGMMEKLKEVNAGLEAAGDPTIAIGIGIMSGKAVVGNIGSRARFDYTVMGDTVNVASRLEGLNKEYKTTLIFGEPVKNKLKTPIQAKHLGDVQVKGRTEPVKIYTLEE